MKFDGCWFQIPIPSRGVLWSVFFSCFFFFFFFFFFFSGGGGQLNEFLVFPWPRSVVVRVIGACGK